MILCFYYHYVTFLRCIFIGGLGCMNMRDMFIFGDVLAVINDQNYSMQVQAEVYQRTGRI
ncbi:hypothetical protein AC02_5146 [Escherichia coli 3-020-07_S3_C1]|nr:hypothetical protein AD02_4964 [Escherichia coli 2-460-02_S4_C2]KDY72480.1 hypothetical protein AD32_4957 [Escherichia coli 2-460-02_S4_C3]KDZ34048.1 hypothetical protein AC02_5146 [Escherichia coli 3-020-07_S3_C1]KEJ39546.1 hypothetical protein AC74_5754 [Escherichia coli 2-460-02_S4_C1]KEJ57161.1 hypothetical protein AC30_5469 [Escherichia coli 3-020-07_S3_C2]KEK75461.1 hypothetical protein AB48_5122 [Escherichia coli 3-475-03_S1_C2]